MGEGQCVQLARAIAQAWRRVEEAEPRLQILNEPTVSLDPGHQSAMMRTLHDLSTPGISILLALYERRFLAAGRLGKILTASLLGGSQAADVEMTTVTDGALVILFR